MIFDCSFESGLCCNFPHQHVLPVQSTRLRSIQETLERFKVSTILNMTFRSAQIQTIRTIVCGSTLVYQMWWLANVWYVHIFVSTHHRSLLGSRCVLHCFKSQVR